MNLSRPYLAVTGSGLEGEVLSVLGRTTQQMTGRQVARLARHGSDRGIRLALSRLAEQGIVDEVEAPPAVLYSLNLDHIAAPMAIGLVHLRDRLVERLRGEIAAWAIQPVHASLFGSVARADGDESSDVDVFVVRPEGVTADDEAWRTQVDALAHAIRRLTGNQAGISEIGHDELDDLRATRRPIVAELQRDAVPLAGKDARRVLRG